MAQMTAPRLYVVGDRGVCRDDAQWRRRLTRVAGALAGCAGAALQVRYKGEAAPYAGSDAARRELAVAMRSGLPVLWNTTCGAPGLAQYAGLHLSERHAAQCACPALPSLLGVSVHSREALAQAAALGASFAVFGPVFDPGSKPGVHGVGMDALHKITANAPIPVLAIGGVTPDRVRACLGAGAWGVACVTPIFTHNNPSVVIARYLGALAHEDHKQGALR